MNRKISVLFFALLLSLLTMFNAFAATPRFADDTSNLDYNSVSSLNDKLDVLSSNHNVDIAAIIVNSVYDYNIGGFEQGNTQEFADDYYDFNGFSDNGVILVINLDERETWISTKGSCITYLTDSGIDYLINQITPYLSEGDYYNAISVFADQTDYLLASAENGEIYDTYTDGGNENYSKLDRIKDNFFSFFIASIVVGLIVGLIAVSSMKAKLTSVSHMNNATEYVVPDSLRLTNQNEVFLYKTVTHAPKPKDESHSGGVGGGGSSVHTSHSGSSHGGGGGHF